MMKQSAGVLCLATSARLKVAAGDAVAFSVVRLCRPCVMQPLHGDVCAAMSIAMLAPLPIRGKGKLVQSKTES